MTEEGLERFLEPVRAHRSDAASELGSGRKRTHWMWFMFPQLRSLGHSPRAVHFGIVDLGEAVRYLANDELGDSYEQLVRIVHDQVVRSGLSISELFGTPDDLKLVSSLTLFSVAAMQLGRTHVARECEEILNAAEAQGLSRCEATEHELAAK